MIARLRSLPFFSTFEQLALSEPSLLFEGLWDAPKAALLSTLIACTNKTLVVITGGERENRLYDDLSYFTKAPLMEFPSWETLPGEEIEPSPDIVGKRLAHLKTLLEATTPHIILTPLQAILQKTPRPEKIAAMSQTLRVGEALSFGDFPRKLEMLGYQKRPVAADKGEFAVRGGIIDLFPVSAFDPYRIEFFDDEIAGIRTYDPIGQKSIEKVKEIILTPAKENAITSKENASTLLDYLGDDAIFIFDDLLAIEDKMIALADLPGARSPLFLPMQEFIKLIASKKKIFFAKEAIETLSKTRSEKKKGRAFYSGKDPTQSLSFEMFASTFQTCKIAHPFQTLEETFPEGILASLSETQYELHFLTESNSSETKLKSDLEGIKLPSTIFFHRGYLSSGFSLINSPFLLIPQAALTKRYKVRREKWRNTYHTPASEFHEMKVGDLVVHFHNGIGKFLGIEKQKNHKGKEEEFFLIAYAENSKLYVPMSQSHIISRYIGTSEELPTLHTLGTTKWQKSKVRAEKSILGYAKDLLTLQAERKHHGGFAFGPDGEDLTLFELEFPFQETEDQLRAIQEIKEDMQSGKAMDRLICGDVGYGKTEVAMRAAFKTVLDGGKQVVVLAPTTVLAMQHFETFKERMGNFPIEIAALSRFVKPKEIKKSLQRAAEGSVDILIGTHRVLSKDVSFKNLGLVIIDEEQRFGVRAKEHLKKLKVGVNCLTLSATPIPRTLYLAMIGGRDMSVISTPPQDRLPIKTIVAEMEEELIKNALLRELARDGQAYFIHNRVASIFHAAEGLQKLLPSARIGVVHGQMASDEIDTIFHHFKQGSLDILVATTIVENGIDIPNANTILIDRADRYGMADLYQLRGRVGRWNRPAYAYFLTLKHTTLSEISRKRLHALVEASGFGGGMKLAMRDLEIRGAGDILGTQQSGNVASIGFHLYCKLLNRAIDALSKKIPTTFIETKMEFPFEAKIPEYYIFETSLRLEIYHRLGDAVSLEEVEEILKEMKDRFGKPPKQVIWLYHMTRLRLIAREKRYTLLKFSTHTLHLEQQLGKKVDKRTLFFSTPDDPKLVEDQVASVL